MTEPTIRPLPEYEPAISTRTSTRTQQINDQVHEATATAIDRVAADTHVPGSDSRLHAAHRVRQEAAEQLQNEAKRLRGAGASWDTVAADLPLDSTDQPRAQRAFELVESLSLARSNPPCVYWQCASCEQHVADFGPDPATTQHGHLPDCDHQHH